MIDDARFEQLVLETQDKALRLAHSQLGDWDEAADAVQEAFVKAYRSRAGFRSDAAVSTWFFRILVNHCRDRQRRRKVRGWFNLGSARGDDGSEAMERRPDPRPGPDRRAEGSSLRKALAEALRHLPARQREVFRLRSLGELSVAETAAVMGISEGAAKTHHFRAVRALRDVLAPWREDP